MTAAELIEKLKQVNPETEVVMEFYGWEQVVDATLERDPDGFAVRLRDRSMAGTKPDGKVL